MFSGAECPGLIEAVRARKRTREQQSFPGLNAPASLKHFQQRLVGLDGRGFPGLNAPASLKPGIGHLHPSGDGEFSGAECPGLIEAKMPTKQVTPEELVFRG